jgi:hypothetical protein
MTVRKNKNSVYKSIEPTNSKKEGRDRAVSVSPRPDQRKKLSLRSGIDGRNSQEAGAASNDLGGGSDVRAASAFVHRDDNGHYLNEPAVQLSSEQLRTLRNDERDTRLLTKEPWYHGQSHRLTYIGLFLFTFTLYFRPYELIPSLSGLNSMAWFLALATLLIYLPSQIAAHGSVTILNTETKCILFLAFWALVTIPVSANPGAAWKEFTETFIKVVIIFIIMANVLRTQAQLKGMLYLGVATGVMLSYEALILYREGNFGVEGYRVDVDFGGMFGNPNDMALHLVIFAPIALSVGLGLKNRLSRFICYVAAALMVGGNFVTQSRAGFLGLMAVALVLIWKLGRGKRLKVLMISAVLGLLFISLAPGDYGTRIISIFVPSLDPVGSSDQRRTLLEQSIWVTLRNPAGIGIGNFPIVGSRNLVTHNAYTQVSAELGWLAFIAYMVFLVSPLRKLSAIDRQLIARDEYSWIYYLSIGLQAGIIGYMVTSFFASVAYQWYIYYPVAFAICLRRIYRLEHISADGPPTAGGLSRV